MRRCILLVLAAGASHAIAQVPTVSYELSFKALPNGQTVLLFGDYAQVVLTARITPPIGTVVTLPTTPPALSLVSAPSGSTSRAATPP